jgi:hypothetical protein
MNLPFHASSRLRKHSIDGHNMAGLNFLYSIDAGITSGCSKRLSSKAAASEEARHTLRYAEPLSDVRTPLGDFFSILLEKETTSP